MDDLHVGIIGTEVCLVKAVKNIFFWLSQSFEVGGFIAGVCVADFFFVKNQMNSLAVE